MRCALFQTKYRQRGYRPQITVSWSSVILAFSSFSLVLPFFSCSLFCSFQRKTVEMEAVVRQTFESVVMLDSYARSEINVVIHVLESDGYVLHIVVFVGEKMV